jgi:nanoRNase/pAp phosphatase (c-di-AMP/oligoRNAs hydrolase)
MKIMVFTDSDLDGVTSFLLFKWFFNNHHIDVENTSITNFRKKYTKWLSQTNPKLYDRIYILDLDIHDCLDLIDTDKHVIIDHHKSHEENNNYKNATTMIKTYSSCCKLMYKLFKNLYNTDPLNKQQKKLLLLVDDYDSYTLQLPESKKLNYIYWNTQNKFKTFIKQYYNGFTDFTYEQQNILKLHSQEIKEQTKNIEIYGVKTKVQNKELTILSTFSDKNINDMAELLLKKYRADIAIVVNNQTKHVSLRQDKNTNKKINLIDFTKKITGDGGGHEFATGAPLSDNFIEFTKKLKKIL